MVSLDLDLRGRRVVCVGGGRVAESKLRRCATGEVVVVAPEVTADLRASADRGELTWWARPFAASDVDGAWLAIAATGSPETDDEVVAAADARRVWCVRSGAARASDTTTMAGSAAFTGLVTRGPLSVAVSTGGRAPAVTARARAVAEETFDPAWGDLAEIIGDLREDPMVRAELSGLSEGERTRRWRSAAGPDILGVIRTASRSDAKEAARACLFSASD